MSVGQAGKPASRAAKTVHRSTKHLWLISVIFFSAGSKHVSNVAVSEVHKLCINIIIKENNEKYNEIK